MDLRLLAFFALVGCSNAPVQSCRFGGDPPRSCLEIGADEEGANLAGACAMYGGAYSPDRPCPSEGRIARCIATCTLDTDSDYLLVMVGSDYAAGGSLEDAQTRCAPVSDLDNCTYDFEPG